MIPSRANLLAIDRRFDAPPAFVFALWSDPRLIATWWGPAGHRLSRCEVDFRIGGTWAFDMNDGTTRHAIHGTYHEIKPLERLVFSYRFPEFAIQSVVSVGLVAEGQGTLMSFRQTGFPDDHHRDGHEGGWSSTFGILQSLLLSLHGIGSVYPTLPPARIDRVAQDLEAARRRHDATPGQMPDKTHDKTPDTRP